MIPQAKPWLGDEETEAVARTIKDNWITEGPMTAAFGVALNDLTGAKYGVFAPNGTLALYLGLLALGIGPGDEVLVPDTTFVASANAVILTGATPVFVDVNDYNYQVSVTRCLITDRTRAIMPVHLYGMSANMTQVMGFARTYNLLVIEDAAEAIGVYYKDRHAGTFGDVGCFSFFADKTITTGEGGYVACRDEGVYSRLRHLRNQGRVKSGTFRHPQVGYNFRITDMQAALGLVQLGKLKAITLRKKLLLEHYHERLHDVEEVKFLLLEDGSTYIPFRAVLICEKAHDLMTYLTAREIQPRTFFYPLHRQPCFEFLGQNDDARFPNAIYGYEHGVCLPIYPTLTPGDVDYICDQIKGFYG